MDLTGWYVEAQARVVKCVSHLSDGEAAVVVPTTPAWTVHDVVAHVAGLVDDALNGRTGGAPSEAWTAAQVERGRGVALAEIVSRWTEQTEGFATVLPNIGRMGFMACADLHAHEQDLYGALGRVDGRDSEAIRFFARRDAASTVQDVATAGLAALRISLDGDFHVGDEGAAARIDVSSWEWFRIFLGRRSGAQIARTIVGVEQPARYVAHIVAFGPSEADIDEPGGPG